MKATTKQPRLRLGELVLDKQLEHICVVMDRAQSPDRHHRVTVYCPATATWFTTKESDFKRFSRHQERSFHGQIRAEKAKQWERILAPIREQAKREKEQAMERKRKEKAND